MSAVIIPNNKLLAVQQFCGVILCKQCKIGISSERSAKDHLTSTHSVNPSAAKLIATKVSNAADAVRAIPNPMREVYLHAPEPVPGSDDHIVFLRPLVGVDIQSGFKCTRCNSCYTSEKGVRNHLSAKHSITGNEEWDRIARNGSIKLQTIFGGNKTKHFPVSSDNPFGLILSAGSHNTQNTPVSERIQVSQDSPTLSNVQRDSPREDQAVEEFFAEIDQALLPEQSSEDLPSSHVNPYLAATEFHIQLRESGFDKSEAATYSALIQDDYTAEEKLAVQDVKDYFLRTRTLAKDISPAVLTDINMIGNREFNIVSEKSATKYALNFARLILCAFRARKHPFIPEEVLKPLNEYFAALGTNEQNGSSETRLQLLHQLLRVLCLCRLSKAESPKKLFIRYFVMFSIVVKNARNQADVFRWAQAKDVTHLLAALLYGASSCAIFETTRIGLRVASQKANSSKHETGQQRKKLDQRLENVLLALDENQNSPAAFVRKTLTVARTICSSEDVSFIFDTCDQHHLCGIVDNIHISLPRTGEIVRNLHKDIESSFTSLLYGASLPPNFYSDLSSLKDSLQDCQSGASFLTEGHAKQLSKKYALRLFNTITRERPAGKAAFTPTSSDQSYPSLVKVFGRMLNRRGVEDWLRLIQSVQDNLLVCTHLSSGSPGRATELETLKLFNTDYAPRNFYISQGRVVIVTRYSKTRALSGLDKVIPRFPDMVTSKLFLTYLIMFRTLETAFVGALYGGDTMKTHMQALFVERGAYYKAPRIRDVVRAEFRKNNLPIEFNHFRHCTKGILPSVVENSPRLQRDEFIAEASVIAHLQAGHSPQIAEQNYARSTAELPSLTSSALRKYKLFSFEWHKCLGFSQHNSHVSNHIFPPPSPQPFPTDVPESFSNSITSTISKSIKQEFRVLNTTISSHKRSRDTNQSDSASKRSRDCSLLPPYPFPFEENLEVYLPALRTFIRDESAMFRSATQLQSTVAIAKAEQNLVLVMPTGAGKTISILLPVFLEGADSSTVFFVPLASLVHEVVERCNKFNISVATWSNRETLAQVYVISADHSRKHIEGFLRTLQNSGRLRRIVFDEAHLLVLWHSFRPSFRRLPYALQSGSQQVQFVLCTATLPPMYRQRLLRILSLTSAVLHAAPTVRFNLKFRVIDTSDRPCAQENGRFLDQDQIVHDELCIQLLPICSDLHWNEGGRIQIFCAYRNQVEKTKTLLDTYLTQELGFPIPIRAYHGAMPPHVLEEVYAFWKTNNAKVKIVVCSAAFGTGLDVPDVRAVIHLGGSNSLLEYAQQTGRAGRDGQQANCILIYNKAIAGRHTDIIMRKSSDPSLTSEQDEEDRRQEWFLMHQYMSQKTSCRKNFIYRHVDGEAPGLCIFDEKSENCDFCDARSTPTPQNTSSLGSHLFSPFILPPPLVQRQPLTTELSSSPSPPQQTIIPETSSGFPTNAPIPDNDQHQNLSAPISSQLYISLNPPATQPPPVQAPLPVARTLNFDSPSTGNATDPLAEFRNAAHALQNICVACFVMERAKKPRNHPCKKMRNRCRRCFQLGHSSNDCKTFNPRRKNFCFGCSLSQVRGENIHQQGEFGSSCHMRVLRDTAWMLWAGGLASDESFRSSLCTPHDADRLEQILHQDEELNNFYLTWLNSNHDGVPNLVRLILWWLPRHTSSI